MSDPAAQSVIESVLAVDELREAELFKLLQPCLAWCHRRIQPAMSPEETAGAFRSAELAEAARRVLPQSCHTLPSPIVVESFDSFGRRRQELLGEASIGPDVLIRECRRTGSLLVTDWAASLFDGAVSPETHGFIDDDCIPPWDTWLGLIRAPGAVGELCLLSWVPKPLSQNVNLGVRVDAAECLSWLSVEEEATRLLGWGRGYGTPSQ